MSQPVHPVAAVRFGPYTLDPSSGELHKNGSKIRLPEQPFQILLIFLQRPGEVVTRVELQKKLWSADTFVDFEDGLNTAVKKLREALNDSADEPRYVETMPRRGYRFICPVEILKHNDRQSLTSAEEPRRRGPIALVSAAVLLVLFLALSSTPVRERFLGAGVRTEVVSQPHARPLVREGSQLYVKGRYFWSRRNREDLLRSLEYFGQVIQTDPNNPWGYVGLADSYAILGNNTFLPAQDTYPKAETAARKALEMDQAIAEAHATLGLVLFHYHWDRQGAERELRRAIELDPNCAVAYQYYSDILSLWKRHDEALLQIHFALALDPTSIRINENLGRNYYFARRYDKAIEALRKTVELDPNRPRGLFDRLGWAYLANGQKKEALAALETAVQFSDRDSLSLAGLGHAYGVTGNHEGAQRILDELIERSRKTYVSPVLIALVYVGLG